MWSAAISPAARAAPLPRTSTGVALAMALALAAAGSGASAWLGPSFAASPPSAAPPPELHNALLLSHTQLYDGGPPMPDFIRPCRRADPDLNICIRDSFNTFVREAFTGVPTLGLPSFEPLRIPYVNMSETVPGNLTLSLLLRDVNVRGLSKSNVVHVRANPAEQKLELQSHVPWLGVDGSFTASGAVLTFPLSAHGAFSVNMTDVSCTWIIYYTEQTLIKGGPKHFVVDHFKFDFAPVDMTYDFGDTLDDDIQLGEAMNMFLNTNAQEVFGDVRGRATDQLGHALRALIDAVLEAFPADRLLLPD